MRTTSKTISILTLFMFVFAGVYAQEYTISAGQANKLVITDLLGELLIEGGSGSAIVINITGVEKPSERADGLKPINSYGVEDNTGLGIAVEEKDGVIELLRASKRLNDANIKILVPSNLAIQVAYNSVHSDDIFVKNVSNELKVVSEHADLSFENISGPCKIYSTHGEINVVFSEINQNSPISVVSPHGDIDVTFPSNAAANIELYAGCGEIFSNLDLEYKKNKEGLTSYSNHIKATLGGGGVDIKIKSDHADIFLRQK